MPGLRYSNSRFGWGALAARRPNEQLYGQILQQSVSLQRAKKHAKLWVESWLIPTWIQKAVKGLREMATFKNLSTMVHKLIRFFFDMKLTWGCIMSNGIARDFNPCLLTSSQGVPGWLWSSICTDHEEIQKRTVSSFTSMLCHLPIGFVDFQFILHEPGFLQIFSHLVWCSLGSAAGTHPGHPRVTHQRLQWFVG